MGLDAALQELEDVDAEEFASRLQEEFSALYKEIYSDGFGAGKTEVKSDLEETESQLESLRSEKQNLENKLSEIQEEQPEAAEVRKKFESKLEEMNSQLETLKQEKESLKQEKREAIRQERSDNFKERAKSRLVQQGVDPDYAEVKIEKATQSGRVQFDDDLQPKVYEEDGEVPTPMNGESPDEVFAESLLQETPQKFIADNRPGETGVGETGSTGGPQTVTDEDLRSGKVDPEDILNDNVTVE